MTPDALTNIRIMTRSEGLDAIYRLYDLSGSDRYDVNWTGLVHNEGVPVVVVMPYEAYRAVVRALMSSEKQP